MNEHQVRWCRYGLVCVFAVLLVACGGGDETEGGSKVAAADEGRRTAANVVLRNDSSAVSVQGSFSTVDGYLSNSAKVLRSHSGAAALARFEPQLPLAGYYEVFGWWPEGSGPGSSAAVEIQHADGRHGLTVDQSISGGQWVSMGVHRFERRTKAAVTFSSLGGATMLVDAVRWHFLGESRPPLDVRTEALALADAGDPYSASVQAWGGSVPYAYSIVQGRLPTGLSLDPLSGTISGVTMEPGTHAFTLSVRDAAGGLTTRELSIDVVQSSQRPAAVAIKPFSMSDDRRRIAASGRSTATGPDLGDLQAIVAAMPEGSWSRVNLNPFSDAWVPAALRNLYFSGNPAPSKVIAAWSSFAWDSNRGNLLLYGGGHANYRGNEVYIWRGSTRRWERGSLPSAMMQDSLGNWNAVDSADRAPASAHTYDNTLFFPALDRMVVLGGAADSNGGHYLRKDTETSSRKTGLYLFDPSRAHPDRVGGSTGSHVQRVAPYPEILGGEMWTNREMFINTVGIQPPSNTYSNGCTGQATEGGKDVAYLRIADSVYRFTIGDINNPATDTWQKVGRKWNGGENKATCAYDPVQKVLLRTATQAFPFVFWDLNEGKAGPTNNDVRFVPADPSGSLLPLLASGAISIRDCGLEHDPVRGQYLLWCDDGRVWSLKPPATVSAVGWEVGLQPAPVGAVPNARTNSGVLGKWKYIPNLDVFMGLQDSVQGNIWIYKPVGWKNPEPGNTRPAVSITQPTEGSVFREGMPIEVLAEAVDNDGQVQKVEFFHGTTKFGEASSPPFTATWVGAPAGVHALTARATDDQGAVGVSTTVSLTVSNETPNAPPTITWVRPSAGASFDFGVPIGLELAASDADGAVVNVAYFDGPRRIGEATMQPFSFNWTDATVGSHLITAIATDDRGLQTVSTAITVTVMETAIGEPVTVVLQRRPDSGHLVFDSFLSSYFPNSSGGGSQEAMLELNTYGLLVRFAVFQSEGGPVPAGATVESAVLSLYKFSGGQQTYGAHRLLEPWTESASTWNERAPGLPWATPGANGIGTDFAAIPDGVGVIGTSAGWVNIDVTAALRQWSGAASTPHQGWRIRPQLASSSLKRYRSSEYLTDPALRPKLAITYR